VGERDECGWGRRTGAVYVYFMGIADRESGSGASNHPFTVELLEPESTRQAGNNGRICQVTGPAVGRPGSFGRAFERDSSVVVLGTCTCT